MDVLCRGRWKLCKTGRKYLISNIIQIFCCLKIFTISIIVTAIINVVNIMIVIIITFIFEIGQGQGGLGRHKLEWSNLARHLIQYLWTKLFWSKAYSILKVFFSSKCTQHKHFWTKLIRRYHIFWAFASFLKPDEQL